MERIVQIQQYAPEMVTAPILKFVRVIVVILDLLVIFLYVLEIVPLMAMLSAIVMGIVSIQTHVNATLDTLEFIVSSQYVIV
jgi:hypothetical protein